MKRKIRILGLSVPVWFIAVILASGVAAAAWAYQNAQRTVFSTQAGASVSLSNLTCTITAGPGTVSSCAFDASGYPAATISGIDQTTALEVSFDAQNTTSGQQVCLQNIPPLGSPEDGYVTVTLDHSAWIGYPNIDPNGSRTLVFDHAFDGPDLGPGMTGISYDQPFSFALSSIGPCAGP